MSQTYAREKETIYVSVYDTQVPLISKVRAYQPYFFNTLIERDMWAIGAYHFLFEPAYNAYEYYFNTNKNVGGEQDKRLILENAETGRRELVFSGNSKKLTAIAAFSGDNEMPVSTKIFSADPASLEAKYEQRGFPFNLQYHTVQYNEEGRKTVSSFTDDAAAFLSEEKLAEEYFAFVDEKCEMLEFKKALEGHDDNHPDALAEVASLKAEILDYLDAAIAMKVPGHAVNRSQVFNFGGKRRVRKSADFV